MSGIVPECPFDNVFGCNAPLSRCLPCGIATCNRNNANQDSTNLIKDHKLASRVQEDRTKGKLRKLSIMNAVK